jgi:hypothetical protein
MSLPIDDRKLILGASDSVSSITEASSSMPSRGSLGCGHRTFTQHRDKCKVMFMDQQSDDTTMSTKPTTDSTDDDLVDDIIQQFDVDFDILCIHVAERKQEELKAEGKLPHHRLTKQMANPFVAPPGDVRRLLGNKVKTIGGTLTPPQRMWTSTASSTWLKWRIASILSPLTTIQRQPGTTVVSWTSTINLTDTLTLRVLTGTSWSSADSSLLVWSPIPTVDH